MRKSVILFSGGMDSFCLVAKAKPDVLVFIDTGGGYNAQEKSLFEQKTRSFYENKFPGMEMLVIPIPSVVDWELPNKVVPFRNHLFSLVDAQYGNDIYIGNTPYETTLMECNDKDIVFQRIVELSLNYFALSANATRFPSPYVLHQPYFDKTKTEIVRDYLLTGGTIQEILSYTLSCRDDDDTSTFGCGVCSTCIRRNVALINNGCDVETLYPRADTAFIKGLLTKMAGILIPSASEYADILLMAKNLNINL